MSVLETLFLNNLVAVFFVYGLSFLLMFVIIVQQGRKSVHFELLDGFILLAGFGLLHGLAEWTDMARLLVTSPPDLVRMLAALKLTLLAVSFQYLLLFGLHVLTATNAEARMRLAVAISPILVLVYATILYLAVMDFGLGEWAARLTLGVSGAALASLAFFKLARTLRTLGLGSAALDSLMVASAFAFYAAFAGLAYNASGQVVLILGIPVQVFRAACAITISIFVARFVSFFRR